MEHFPSNEMDVLFGHSMQVVATSRNKVYLLGGAKEITYQNLSDYMFEWDVKTNKVEMK